MSVPGHAEDSSRLVEIADRLGEIAAELQEISRELLKERIREAEEGSETEQSDAGKKKPQYWQKGQDDGIEVTADPDMEETIAPQTSTGGGSSGGHP